MRRPVALRLQTALAASAVAVAATGVVVAVSIPEASAATGSPTGYATQNGGTTGGAGGQTVRATTGTAIHSALCNRASSSTPITIEVEGTINHGNTSKVSGNSCNTADGVIELKQISNVTIVGVGNGAVFDQLGIHIREARNIIIQNVTIRNVKKSGSPTSNGGDAIGMENNVRNVWVDHVTLEASGGESEGFDGLFDLKNNTQYVTLSYSILRNSGRGGLIGSSESDRPTASSRSTTTGTRTSTPVRPCCVAASRTSTTTTTWVSTSPASTPGPAAGPRWTTTTSATPRTCSAPSTPTRPGSGRSAATSSTT